MKWPANKATRLLQRRRGRDALIQPYRSFEAFQKVFLVLRQHSQKFLRTSLGKGSIIDCAVEFLDGNVFAQLLPQRCEQRTIGIWIVKWSIGCTDDAVAAQREKDRDRSDGNIEFLPNDSSQLPVFLH